MGRHRRQTRYLGHGMKIRRPMQAFAATKRNEETNKLVATRFIDEMWNQRKLELAEEWS
jgi:hypothetical protein